jgi:hypothetical protein
MSERQAREGLQIVEVVRYCCNERDILLPGQDADDLAMIQLLKPHETEGEMAEMA